MEEEKEYIEVTGKKLFLKNVQHSIFNFRQCMDIGDLHLDTFWKRLRWFLKGK